MKRGAYGDAKGDTGFRRKFNVEDYKKGKKPEDDVSVVTAKKDVRVDQIDFEKVVNKVQVVQVAAHPSKQPGFKCEVCDRIFKDNVSFTDHMISKQHQEKAGIVGQKKASVDDVMEKLNALKRKKDTKEEFDFDEQLRQSAEQAQQEELDKKEEKRRKKLDKKQKAVDPEQEPEEEMNADIAAMMGFGGFGTSKK